jgi:hypothetical protein
MKRIGFTALAAIALSVPALAQTGDRDVLEAMARCAAMADSAQRLSCYDAAAPRLRTTLATPPQVLARAPSREEESSWFGFKMPDLFGSSTSSQTTPQQFGANTLSSQQRADIATGNPTAAAPTPVDSITATVTEYAQNPRGNYVMFLDNGQVWRQQEGDGGVMQFKRNAPNTVRISRGFWDSYNLKLNTGSALYKVVRVK